ncbi:RagB/SusD family nutrient uptake outer membrane protein [Flavobacterium capsici]|uniref:RagB/SusD family nutrient uptake outer membrane protein n=1 Tax=Flavobacterium capsici TaxID=3075618 RepID=A0AA96ESP5_9FLAO|nr:MULTISPECIES: RagB/SusD family nutrient uptake outer membrane protein [unclassified Flavobacterium]WNM17748.1 RagB/SusD family nutrient uptake outer membrane protein [Flavobacterium sp. PMR2A8]WNM21801.1 RagB/SusD family nutrient uptake outer membrane protein [Flavobacterium sp. PMTSA4]
MKKIVIISGILIGGLLASCNDYLEAPSVSSLDEQVIFSSPGLAKSAVDGIKIPFGETDSYRGRFLPWYGMNTDSEWYNSSESTSSDNADLCTYDAKPNNSQMNKNINAWAMMYSGIERANLCIRGLRTYGNPTPGSELGYLLGEALTLRAVYYTDLLRAWGDVPARFEPIVNETVYIPKSSRDVIYKQLIADLGEAATLVPWPNGSAATSDVERINKAFVKGLRARLAMYASGFQQYPDGIRRSNDPELSVELMYNLALNECKDVILSGTAHLESSFETFWRNYNKEITTAGGESLWEIPFGDGRGRMLFTFAVRHTTPDQFHSNGSNRGGQAGPLPHIFYDYDVADTRRNVTCVPYLWGAAVNGIAKQQLGSINRWYFGKYRYEWMTRFVTSTNDDGVNKIYMRYAEILLMAAEAANELEGPAAAAPYLKQIRNRAFPAALQPVKVEGYVNALTTKQAMFNAIVEEHKFEFTGEMERKMALIRWNLLGTNLADAKAKMVRLQQRTGEYADVPSTLYYKYNADNITLNVYGLNHGETSDPGAGYTSVSWTNLTDAKINGLWRPNQNPDNRQFWPIWQVFLDSSNGLLVNDYNY